jgi:voltage-gated potassium channel
MTLRRWLYHALEEQKGGRIADIINSSLVILITANVVVVMLESESSIHRQYSHAFLMFEWFSVLVFTIEYVVRLWVCVESEDPGYQRPGKYRWRYLFLPLALLDLLAILPFYLSFLFGVTDLLFLRSLRLLRILKLARYSHSLHLLIQVLKQEAETLVSALFIFCLLLLLAATGMYLVEGNHQPESFGSIPRALWWATVTLATVGYGDVVPLTLGGKVLSGVLIVLGIAIAALPAAILASGLINELERRRNTFRAEMRSAIHDGHLDFAELRMLEKKRAEVGISRADARLIFEEVKQEVHSQTRVHCPYCKRSLVIGHPPGHVNVHAASPTV